MVEDLDQEQPTHDEEWADRTFPDRGPAPSNEVTPDPSVKSSPNIAHPR